MGPMTMVAIYLVCWWTVLFAVLPLGTKTHAEMGIDLKDGGDPGAPVNPNLKRKFITTTWVSAIVWLVVMVVVWSGVIPMPSAPPV
ncbi:DUF1467 family protein [Caulobacter sp. 17J65-9]|uniref:DUF1467 family protein n=1 Tax=Caulobacter sp. 17J65-9 TaxID=2709382 RepID=UPI0013CAB8BF|nr:DUF1467 family protein [Caulobacter sp. 17J65-9]NEX94506.1 DUF1467 family protein [Caulobacter sp. 17J65-9]